MARPDPHATPCVHLANTAPGQKPLTLVRLLDEVGGIADALVRCAECQQAYLIELIEWSGTAKRERRFRVSTVDEALLTRFLKNLDRGSCDIRRAPAEKQSFESQTRLAPLTIALRADDLTVIGVEHLSPRTEVPMGSWRERLR
jgi:hypothetical protein